jgi:hypothetical protein
VKTIGHQTLNNSGNDKEVETKGPFKTTDKNPYLGYGYYFWDNNIEMAHTWGRVHCDNKYIICQANLNLKSEVFLDLVGSRDDIMYFEKLINTFGVKHKPIGQIIEYLKKIESDGKFQGIFPFKVIRALDYDKDKFKKYKFADNKKGYTSLRPVFIICLIEKNNLILSEFKMIHKQ